MHNLYLEQLLSSLGVLAVLVSIREAGFIAILHVMDSQQLISALKATAVVPAVAILLLNKHIQAATYLCICTM